MPVNRRMMSKWNFEMGREALDWICLAEDRNNWRAFVKTIVKLSVR